MTTRTTRLSVVASVVVFTATSLTATQQAYAGPFGNSLGPFNGPASLPGPGIRKPFSDSIGPSRLGPKVSDIIPSGPKVPPGSIGPFKPGPKVSDIIPPGPKVPGPAPAPKPAPLPGGGHGKGGGHWGGLGGGMAAGLIGGLALSAMAAQATQARPAVVQGDCWLEERRVRDAYGNRYIKEVRVCDE